MDEHFENLTFYKEANLEDKLFYLFRNSENEYRVIEARDYQSFYLKPGMTIRARVRKRGCAGQEISELIHPIYTEGKEYLFKIVRTGSLVYNNEKMHFLAVLDALGTEYKVKVGDSSKFAIGKMVKCRLEDQTQGRLKFSIT
jgi:hypothetical protein